MNLSINQKTSVVEPLLHNKGKSKLLEILLQYKQNLANIFLFNFKTHIRINLVESVEKQPPRKDFDRHLKIQKKQAPGFFFWLFFTKRAETLEYRRERISKLLSIINHYNHEMTDTVMELCRKECELKELKTKLEEMDNTEKKIDQIKKENNELKEYYRSLDKRIKNNIEFIQKKTPNFRYNFHYFTFNLTNFLWHIVLKYNLKIDIFAIARVFNLYYYYAMIKHHSNVLDSRGKQLKRIEIILNACLSNQGLPIPDCSNLLPLYCIATNRPMPALNGATNRKSMTKVLRQLHKRYPILDDHQNVKIAAAS
ncbi:hypothetical protein MTBBW1_530002 [Desulfamplus magnetovallimortis]|uniref:Uncharacterized protein n=1 Tax=Desulfamplus magnetovallimortis TaxID=1246637 RepID=A0A1W1HHM7_9BACT|nr:hypothetical protein [Desulfamplus magnetovallimortis]SLM31997.1 hypothetical protein MTBBW1_530002 [Desulfamplus magnetovallimortis]